MSFKLNDKVRLLTEFYEDDEMSLSVNKGSVLEVLSKCRTEGQWIDQTSVEFAFLNPPYNHEKEFELVEEEKVKKRFAIGDKVVSIKDTPIVPEGFVGYIVEDKLNVLFEYAVSKEFTHDVIEYFREDELELLSVASVNKKLELPVKPTVYDTPKPDVINSPKHYSVFESVEAIQVIASSMTQDQFYGYCLGNILKYRLRAGGKDDVMQELGKADRYQGLYTENKHLCKEGK